MLNTSHTASTSVLEALVNHARAQVALTAQTRAAAKSALEAADASYEQAQVALASLLAIQDHQVVHTAPQAEASTFPEPPGTGVDPLSLLSGVLSALGKAAQNPAKPEGPATEALSKPAEAAAGAAAADMLSQMLRNIPQAASAAATATAAAHPATAALLAAVAVLAKDVGKP